MSSVVELSWNDVGAAANLLASRHSDRKHIGVYGIPTGGSVIAPWVADCLGVPVVPRPSLASLIVDDLADSGSTMREVMATGFVGANGVLDYDCLFRKDRAPTEIAPYAVQLGDAWVKFPWEREARPEDAVVRVLQYVGEDPGRDGLKGTPGRVLRALREMTAGMSEDPKEILTRQFELGHDEMVVLRGVPFTSLCEHHMLPFSGTAAVAYIPDGGKVVGLSKLARLVLCFARRLQIQERMTSQVVDAIEQHLQPIGCACVVSAEHSCMACRGVKLSGTSFVTSALRGVFKSDVAARSEVMSLLLSR